MALLLITVLAVIGVALFVNLAPTFGAAPARQSLARIEASPNYTADGFVNLVKTELSTQGSKRSFELFDFIFPPEGKNPVAALPSEKFNAKMLSPNEFVWFGHSTVLFKTQTLTVLTDPIFHRASPVPFTARPFDFVHPPAVDDLPPIDVVLISHDHYDHLDHLAIQALDTSTEQFLVPLGLRAHLEHWGVAPTKITEFDWYESVSIGAVSFTLTPSRHFSGRGITNRNSTLWASWVVKSNELSVFFSGDSGYFDEFKSIGNTYGPFDIAFIENGAYNDDWSQIHMLPEESVQTAIDLRATLFFPIHWGKFDLSLHPWQEPIQRASAAADQLGVTVVSPLVGEIFNLMDVPDHTWWQ